MGIFLALVIGIGLSAATGFRVFVPLLGVSAASLAGRITLSPGFEWMGTWPAFAAFATATVLEIAAYYVPWVDNIMDTLTTPAAVAAGIIVTASLFTDVSPWIKWTVAAIAGGGVAAAFQAATVALRAGSTVTTAGTGNFVLSTVEWILAAAITLLAILVPVLCLLLLLYIAWRILKRIRGRPSVKMA